MLLFSFQILFFQDMQDLTNISVLPMKTHEHENVSRQR